MKTVIVLLVILMSSPAFAEDISQCKNGWQKTEAGFHSEAIELFNKCIETGELSDSSLARTFRNIGIANKRSGQFEEAIKYYDLALSLNPDDPWDDYVNRGNAWSELGEYKKAFADYNNALKVNPNYGEAYYNRGIIFEKRGENQKAVAEFKQAYEFGLRTQLLYERFVVHGIIDSK